MDLDEIGFVMLVLGAILALPTAVMVFIVVTDDGGLRRFHATPRQPIRTAQGNLVKIAGRAAAREPTVGPFTGRDVVWYTVVVTEHEYFGDGTRRWTRITRHLMESSRASFTITDDSGASARIVSDGEEVFSTVTTETIDLGSAPLPDRVQRALDERGIETRTKDGEPKRLVCIERSIAPGDTVIAIGPARRVPSAAIEPTSYRDAPTELVVGERGPGGKQMFVLTNGPESELEAGDRRFVRIMWLLGAITLALLGCGSWLFFA